MSFNDKDWGGCHPRNLSDKLKKIVRNNFNTNQPTKRQRVLAWLIASSECGCTVTRFDAEWVGDHCFNTTVTEIGRDDGIKVHRAQTKVPNRFGGMTDCKQYWLSSESIQRAKNSLKSRGWKNV